MVKNKIILIIVKYSYFKIFIIYIYKCNLTIFLILEIIFLSNEPKII